MEEKQKTNVIDGKQKDFSLNSQQQFGFTDDQKAIFTLIADDIKAGTRAYALGEWELAISHFGQLAELSEQAFGSDSPRYADALVLYGRALLQNAISQNELMGQKKIDEAHSTIFDQELENENSNKNANIVFSGEPDLEYSSDEQEEETPDVAQGSSSSKVEQASETSKLSENTPSSVASSSRFFPETSNYNAVTSEEDDDGDFQTAWQ
ncbi:hypothetical protein BB560_006016, partial [Smittium megazygosporum]